MFTTATAAPRNSDGTADMSDIHATTSRLLLVFLLAGTLLGSGCGQTGHTDTETTGDIRAVHTSVDRNKLTVTFSSALDQTQKPASELFTVAVNGVTAPIKTVTVKEHTVDLQLRDTVRHDDQAQLSFVNTDTADTQLRTVEQVPVSDFAGLAATNNTVHWYLVTVVMMSFVVGILLVCFLTQDRLFRTPQHS